ncbi:hypothetical protein AV654_19570 [Paenibacillus elgii]|uniref:Bacterial type II secretion system protein E domain-containing protein n=2 Tax=Paenibacillus elgii TaxID=189691 RepID=A0A163XNH7_9BACL|nr:hypothetical protein AV654_19570 [Paenibacillus elgii]
MVSTITRELVYRWNDKIERKKYNVYLNRVRSLVNEYDYFIAGTPEARLVEMIVDAITGYDILHPFVANQAITNIDVQAFDDVRVMEDMRWRKPPISFGSEQKLQDYIHRLFLRLGGRFSLDNPLAKVEDEEWNLRIRAAGFDVSPDSPTLTIRKLRKEALGPEEIKYAMSDNIHKFLDFTAKAGYTVGFVGPFGSGKTTVLGTFISWMPTTKKVGLIQSSNEIPKVHPFMIRRMTREKVGERGRMISEIDILDFIKQENPQSIALGEFLDGAALTMLHILQLGIQSCFTYHANDPRGAIQAFVFMMMRAGGGYDVRYLIEELAKNMDLVVIMDRRRVREIIQFTGEIEEGSYMPVYKTLYKFNVESENKYELMGSWSRDYDVRLCDKLVEKAKLNGVPIPPELRLV